MHTNVGCNTIFIKDDFQNGSYSSITLDKFDSLGTNSRLSFIGLKTIIGLGLF